METTEKPVEFTTTDGVRLTLSRTACKIAAKEGWEAEQILETFDNPKAIYENKQREGQFRIAGTDIVIVGVPMEPIIEWEVDGDTEVEVIAGYLRFHGITLIVNGSKAPVK